MEIIMKTNLKKIIFALLATTFCAQQINAMNIYQRFQEQELSALLLRLKDMFGLSDNLSAYESLDYVLNCNEFFSDGTMVDATQVINPAVIPDYFALMVHNDVASRLREMFLQQATNRTDGYSLNLKRYIKQAKLNDKQKSLHELLALQKLTNAKKPKLPLILYAPHKPTNWTHETATFQHNLNHNPNFSDVAFVKEFKN